MQNKVKNKNSIRKIIKFSIYPIFLLFGVVNFICVIYASSFLLSNKAPINYSDIDLKNITYEEIIELYIDAVSKILMVRVNPVDEYNVFDSVNSSFDSTKKETDYNGKEESYFYIDDDGNQKSNQPYLHPFLDDYFGKEKDLRPIHRVHVDDTDSYRKNKMCITFDSAYINKYTYRILDILDKYNSKATFFMTADFIKKNPEQVKEIVKRGHEVGNHSTKHPKFTNITEDKIISEVLECHKNFKDITNLDMCLFRYPYGEYSEKTMYILKQLGYYSIQWYIDSADWKNDGASKIMERLEKHDEKIVPGSIILFHNGATYTPDCLAQIIEKIQKKGLELVRVSDMIYEHGFYVDIEGKQYIPSDEEREVYKSIEKKPIKY